MLYAYISSSISLSLCLLMYLSLSLFVSSYLCRLSLSLNLSAEAPPFFSASAEPNFSVLLVWLPCGRTGTPLESFRPLPTLVLNDTYPHFNLSPPISGWNSGRLCPFANDRPSTVEQPIHSSQELRAETHKSRSMLRRENGIWYSDVLARYTTLYNILRAYDFRR